MDLNALLAHWGVPIVFAAVLSEQAGLPLPAAPILIAAGALTEADAMRPEHVLFAAISAALLADHLWFALGRRFGRRVLSTLCRLSLSPDTCVRQTDDLFVRHGPGLLIAAKFIPGVSAVAIPTSAAMGLSYRRFIAYDLVACMLWSAVYVGAGVIFSTEIERAMNAMSWIGGGAGAILGSVFLVYIGAKVLHRRRLRHLHELVRISPDETAQLLAREDDIVIIDARSQLAIEEDSRLLPRSILLGDREVTEVIGHLPRDQIIVTFCTCPSEASAALLAEQLLKAGYSRVRVLTGGADALTVLVGTAES